LAAGSSAKWSLGIVDIIIIVIIDVDWRRVLLLRSS